MNVKCPGCKKVFRAKETLAGKRVKCQSCGAGIDIPQLENDFEAVPVAPKPQWKPSPGKNDVYSNPQPGPLTKTCPSCGAAMAENAILCVQCGYSKSGKLITEVKTDQTHKVGMETFAGRRKTYGFTKLKNLFFAILPQNYLLRFIIVTILVAVPVAIGWTAGFSYILTQNSQEAQTSQRESNPDEEIQEEANPGEDYLKHIWYIGAGIGLLVGIWAANRILLLSPMTVSIRVKDGAMFSTRVGEAVKKIGYQYESESDFIYCYGPTAKEGRLLGKIIVDACACWQGGEFAKISGPAMYVKKLRKLLVK